MTPISKLKNKILIFIRSKGYLLIKTEDFNNSVDYYRKVLNEYKNTETVEKIDSIVFSKDRAMQLHAFLCSYIELVQERGTMYVLYKVSDDRHSKAYDELKEIFRNEKIEFIAEENFRTQLIQLCENSTAMTIGLYVDDMIFTQKVNYKHILSFDTLSYVVNLGRGKELDYSVVLNKKQPLPEFQELPNDFQCFKWNYLKTHNDWTFPVGVGGYFFGRNELVVMLQNTVFKAPNTLEINLQQFKPFFINRFGVCKSSVSCVGVHANMVQTEFPNPVIGTFSIEELLNSWEDGLKIDISKFNGIPGNIAQYQAYEFLNR